VRNHRWQTIKKKNKIKNKKKPTQKFLGFYLTLSTPLPSTRTLFVLVAIFSQSQKTGTPNKQNKKQNFALNAPFIALNAPFIALNAPFTALNAP
jgi:hypothetical protein